MLVPICCVELELKSEPEPSPGAGAVIESEALEKAPDGPKRGGSGERTPAPEHCN